MKRAFRRIGGTEPELSEARGLQLPIFLLNKSLQLGARKTASIHELTR